MNKHHHEILFESFPSQTVYLESLQGDHLSIENIVLLLAAKTRQRVMSEEILNNVDSEGSTLLHLAVDSGSLAVSTPRTLVLTCF